MRVPRDVSADELLEKLSKFGYEVTRQKGSHIRMVTARNGEHHVTIPNHNPVRVRTLAKIIQLVAGHFKISREEVLTRLFEK
jgi:predicted RNA binding protein YcfA (HicA-like mRNA interferase family)